MSRRINRSLTESTLIGSLCLKWCLFSMGLGMGIFFLSLSFLFGQTGTFVNHETIQVNRKVQLMGTWCELAIHCTQREEGLSQLEDLIRILENTENELSTWRPGSTLSRLNSSPIGQRFVLDRRICLLFRQLFSWSQDTESAFDPSLGALVKVWGLRTDGRRPSIEELGRARSISGLANFDLNEDGCFIVRRGPAKIDAGAFGKGEALDRAYAYSKQTGLKPWLINFGGQIMAHKIPPQQDYWEVSAAHPRTREVLCTLRLSSGALAVSGGSERDVRIQGERIGHVIDPRTGFPALFEGSVMVWHPRALVADMLSTALFVMGVEEGLKWAESRNLAASFFTKPDQQHALDSTQLEMKSTKNFILLFPSISRTR